MKSKQKNKLLYQHPKLVIRTIKDYKMSQELISEVQEYTVMYTFNIIQKIKKWNDGKLKFFKFNNKVQVFNDDSILITSQFLQNDKQLQPDTWGTEIKIGGVLVTIEEMVSKTSRDISNVFKKESKAKTVEIKENCKTIPPLQNKINSPSLTLSRRRVGLSKNMTPSKISQRMTQRNGSSTTDPVIRRPLMNKVEPDNLLLKAREKKTTPKLKPIPKPQQKHIMKETTLETPISNKTTNKHYTDFGEGFDELDTPSLIPSDKYFLLGPKRLTTPSKPPNQQQSQQEPELEIPLTQINFKNGEIRWDDESLTKSNTKIQNSLNSLMPSPNQTPVSKPVKRIRSDRSKREMIKISRPRITLSDISNQTRNPVSKASKRKTIEKDYSDSEFDEIESQSQSQSGSIGLRNDKITQTETYDYQTTTRGNNVRVSEL